jgi:hypothetical protein
MQSSTFRSLKKLDDTNKKLGESLRLIIMSIYYDGLPASDSDASITAGSFGESGD